VGVNEQNWKETVSQNGIQFIADPEEEDPEWSRGRILADGVALRYQLDFPYSVRSARRVEDGFRKWKRVNSANGLPCAFGRVADVAFWILGPPSISQEKVDTVADRLILNLLNESNARKMQSTPQGWSIFLDY
jgi:hypothetical protein